MLRFIQALQDARKGSEEALQAAGEQMYGAHESYRFNCNLSCDEVDMLVESVREARRRQRTLWREDHRGRLGRDGGGFRQGRRTEAGDPSDRPGIPAPHGIVCPTSLRAHHRARCSSAQSGTGLAPAAGGCTMKVRKAVIPAAGLGTAHVSRVPGGEKGAVSGRGPGRHCAGAHPLSPPRVGGSRHRGDRRHHPAGKRAGTAPLFFAAG